MRPRTPEGRSEDRLKGENRTPVAGNNGARDRGLAIALILILAFQGELIAFWFQNYLRSAEDFVPLTLHVVWEVAAFVLCARVASKIACLLWGGTRESLGMSIFATAQFAALGACVVGIVGLAVPADWESPLPAYSGIVVHYPSDRAPVHIGQGVERPSRGSSRATFLYARDSPELRAALDDYRNRSLIVNVEQFAFWRTGLAAGFQPIGLNQRVQTFAPGMNTSDRAYLLFTAGPAVVLECLLSALLFSGPVLLFLVASWKMVKDWKSKRSE